MPDPIPSLADARRLVEGATDGVWASSRDSLGPFVAVFEGFAWQQLVAVGSSQPDAEFIAASRTLVPALLAAVEGVLAVHRPVDRGRVERCCEGCESSGSGPLTERCVSYADCPTVRAITAHVRIEEEVDRG